MGQFATAGFAAASRIADGGVEQGFNRWNASGYDTDGTFQAKSRVESISWVGGNEVDDEWKTHPPQTIRFTKFPIPFVLVSRGLIERHC